MDEVKVNELIIKPDDTVSVRDRMVIEDEDGTKTAMLSSIQALVSRTTVYPSYKDLENGILNGDISNGLVCHTLGYYKINDNGGADYLITTDTDKMNPDTDKKITNANTNVDYAIILLTDEYVTPEQFGAYGNNTIDDADAIKKALSSGYKVKFKSDATYYMRQSIILKNGMYLDFNNSTLRFNGCDGFKSENNEPLTDITIKNLMIDAINTSICINIGTHIDNLTIDNLIIKNYSCAGAITIKSMNQCNISNVNFIAKDTATSPIAFKYGISNLNDESFGPITNGVLCFNNISINRACPAFDFEYSKGNIIKITDVKYNGIKDDIDSNLIRCNHSTSDSIIQLSTAVVNNAAYCIYTKSCDKITIKDICILNSLGLLDQISISSKVILEGEISLSSDDISEEKKAVYNHIYGTIIHDACIDYDDSYRLMHMIKNENNGSVSYNYAIAQYTGNLIDKTHPTIRFQDVRDYEELIAIKNTSTLEVRSDHNTKYYIKASDQLQELVKISSGLHGQIIQLCSNRLIEIIPDNRIKLDTYTGIRLANHNKRVFIGNGSEVPDNEEYRVSIDKTMISESIIGNNSYKTVKTYVRPTTDSTMEVYLQFSDINGEGYGVVFDKSKSQISLTISLTEVGTGNTITKTKNLTLDELTWEASTSISNTKNSQKILLNEFLEDYKIIDINTIDSISIIVNCDNLYINDTPIGISNISLSPKHIFGNFVFYPAGILLQKSSEYAWDEI